MQKSTALLSGRQWAQSFVLGMLLIGTFLLTYMVAGAVGKTGVTIAFLDVGQGDSIYIESPTGNQVLIDGGPNGTVLARLGEVLPFYDRSLDLMVETHPDRDHSGGLPSVLESYEMTGLLRTTGSEDDSDSKLLLEKAKEKGVIIVSAKRGQLLDLGGGATLEILFPDRYLEGTDPNLKSIVSLLRYGNTTSLLTADAPESIEKYLIKLDGKKLAADILKLGHHGSKTSSSRDFLGYVSPEYAIVSAGKDNRYGHPAEDVLERLQNFDIAVIRTDQEGTITFISDGTKFLRLP